MAAVITVLSSDDDEVEIVDDITPTSVKLKSELTISVVRDISSGCDAETTSTFLKTSVAISTAPPVSTVHIEDPSSRIGFHKHEGVKDVNSDDEIICLGTKSTSSRVLSFQQTSERKNTSSRTRLNKQEVKIEKYRNEEGSSDDEIICLGTQNADEEVTSTQAQSTQKNTSQGVEDNKQNLKQEKRHGEDESSDDEIICLGTQNANELTTDEKVSSIRARSKEKSSSQRVRRNNQDLKQEKQHSEDESSDDEIICLETQNGDDEINANEKATATQAQTVENGANGSPAPEVIFIDSDGCMDDDSRDFDFLLKEDGGTEFSKDNTKLKDEEERVHSDGDLANVLDQNESSGSHGEDSVQHDEGSTNHDEAHDKDTETKENKVFEVTPSDMDGQTSCSTSQPQADIEVSRNGPGNFTETLLRQLITKVGQVGLNDKNVNCIKKKIMKYYNAAPEDFTQSDHFIDMIKNVITEISRMSALPNSKDIVVLQEISDKLREFLNAFQRSSSNVTVKLTKLYRMWEKLNKRIKKLEVQVVDSDSEYEDSYVMLGRYREKACLVYDRICELEGKANHANRNYKQRFIYPGVGPIPVQRALERYYNKTKLFPDFQDVYDLVKRVSVESKLGMSPSQAHLVAQNVFTDFGKKLKRRREYDDYVISRSYLTLESRDPSEFDTELQTKLLMNSKLAKNMDDVFSSFVTEQANLKNGKSLTKTSGSDESGDEPSPTQKSKDLFMDSDEEMAYLENIESTLQPIENADPPAKKIKTTRLEK